MYNDGETVLNHRLKGTVCRLFRNPLYSSRQQTFNYNLCSSSPEEDKSYFLDLILTF